MKQGLLFALSLLSAVTPRTSTSGPPKAPVTIVYVLTGEASQKAPGQPRQPIRLFDRLPAGAVLDVAPGAHLTLAFASGNRWALGGGARATLGATDLGSRAGDVRRLPSVPPLPRLAPIRKDEHAGRRAGAVRIRGERIKGLYPDCGATAMASATVLRFQAVEGPERYKIEVQDGKGEVVFAADTDEAEMRLPADLLHPGAPYHWSVRTMGRTLGEARGEAGFTTLDRDTARRREALRRAAAGQGELTALLAGLDRQLGLLAEARDELRSAVAAAPGDAALSAALAEVEQDLSTDPEDDSAPSVPAEQGLAVEEVAVGSAAARAGIVPGDLLQREPRRGTPAEQVEPDFDVAALRRAERTPPGTPSGPPARLRRPLLSRLRRGARSGAARRPPLRPPARSPPWHAHRGRSPRRALPRKRSDFPGRRGHRRARQISCF